MSNKTLTKQEIKLRKGDFTHNMYSHGGSRIYIDGDSGDRQLIVDTYYDTEFAEYIEKCVKEYFFPIEPLELNGSLL